VVTGKWRPFARNDGMTIQNESTVREKMGRMLRCLATEVLVKIEGNADSR
jgi:hypothetical protein